MSILKIKDLTTGEWDEIPSIQGPPGQLDGFLTLGIDGTDGLAYVYYNGVRQGTGINVGGGGAQLQSINASYSQSGTVYVTDTIDSLKADLVVTGHYSDGSTQTVAARDYTLSGTLEVGMSTITVTYRGLTTTFQVIVRQRVPYETVTWGNTLYGIGDNTAANYNAWAPGCAHYDPTLGMVVFLQCHRTKHGGTYSNSQLWAIDPYDVMNNAVLLHEFAPVGGYVPLGFDIADGVYYVLGSGKMYSSSDHGQTWTENSILTPPGKRYGLKVIDGVMYTGDDAMSSGHNGLYYSSVDFGINWTAQTFDFADDYPDDLTCSEANFIKFNDRLYAALRREGKTGLLAVLDNGEWKVLSDQMPNVTSDAYMFATDDDVICFVAIDRPSKLLKIGTIEISENDEATITIGKSVSVETKSGDFHTPTYVIGPDFNMVTFMVSAYDVEYDSANNVALVGYTSSALNHNPDYTVTKGTGAVTDITESAYVGTAPVKSGSHWSVTAGSVINLTRRYPNTFPLEGSKVIFYKPNKGYIPSIATANAYGRLHYDAIEIDGVMYCCLVIGYSSSTMTGKLKAMYPAKRAVRADVDSIGGIVPEGGEFTYALYCPVNLPTDATILSYLSTTAESE